MKEKPKKLDFNKGAIGLMRFTGRYPKKIASFHAKRGKTVSK